MNIIGKRNIFFIISLLIIAVGFVFLVSSGLNLGIDFTGGTSIHIDLNKQVSVSEIREITDEIDENADIIHAGEGNKEVIIKTSRSLDNEQRKVLLSKFKDKYNVSDGDITSENFGPAIGKEIQQKAYISILIATICMLIYITYRFEFKFGIAAVIALVHDVLITLSVFTLFKIPVTSSFVAAILTIVGYSINDTIVVFDRIRENLKKMKKEPYEDIINKSISQTIIRSINTSFTTLLAITSLYIFGVEAIKDFALPLIVGVLAGTYSSIFIASPAWFMLKTSNKSHNKINV